MSFLAPLVSEMYYSVSGLSTQLSLTVLNKSDAKTSYAVFCEEPTIQSSSSLTVRRYYLDAAYGVDYTYGRAEFDFSKRKYGVCGSLDGDPQPATNTRLRATALSAMPVTLGYRKDDNTLVQGTTCQVVVDPGDSPSFSHDSIAPSGAAGSFVILNDDQFSESTARDGNFFEGFGLLTAAETTPCAQVMLAATVLPLPGRNVQIQPTDTYYVVAADVAIGSSVPVGIEKTGSACKVDFAALGSARAVVVHGSNGRLVLQKSS